MDDNKKGISAGMGLNEGEGNKTADKQYREKAEHFAKEGGALNQAQDAARELEENPGEFESAEKAGRSHSAGDLPKDLGRK